MTTVATAEVQMTASGEGKVTSALGGVAGALGKIAKLAIAGAASKYTMELLQMGVAAQRAERALNVLSDGDANEYFEAISEAVNDTMSRVDAMTVTNRLLSMGLADSADSAADFIRVAATLGGVFQNLRPAEAAEQFALMMANMSVERLDSFGISSSRVRVRIEELMAATPGLTRELAFQQAVMEAATDSAGQFGDALDDLGGDIEQTRANLQDLGANLGMIFGTVLSEPISFLSTQTEMAADAATAIGSELIPAYRQLQTQWAMSAGSFQEFAQMQADFIHSQEGWRAQLLLSLPGISLMEAGYNRLMETLTPTAAEFANMSEEARRFGVNASAASQIVADNIDEAAARVVALAETPAEVKITSNALEVAGNVDTLKGAITRIPNLTTTKITGNFLEAYSAVKNILMVLGQIAGSFVAHIGVSGGGSPTGYNPGGGGSDLMPGVEHGGAGGLAAGGHVSAGSTHIVGEQGPELFVSSSSGYVVPNSVAFGGGGGGGQLIQITIPILLDGREVGRGAFAGTLDQLQASGVIRGGMVA